MNTKKLLSIGAAALLLLVVVVAPVSADELTFTGTTGLITDSDASYGQYYLRHVGNPAPAGYSHNYQWENPVVVCDPNNTPTELSGTIDVSDMEVGEVVMLGLLDKNYLAAGNSGFQTGAYLYVYKNNASNLRIGPSDGNDSGEIVQVFGNYTIPGDGILDVEVIFDNFNISVSVEGNTPLVDTYGDIPSYTDDEFSNGAYLGWDVWPGGTQMSFDFDVSGCTSPDLEAPVVELNSPEEASVISGLVDIVGSITDNKELSHYNLSLYPGDVDLSDGETHSGDRLNDSRWCTTPISGTVNLTDNFSGNLCEDWDTTQYPDGDYQIRLAARDAEGNRDLGDPYSGDTSSVHVISVTINNTPDNKDQCKDGGWMSFFTPEFKNQGDCVSYLQSNYHAKGNKNK